MNVRESSQAWFQEIRENQRNVVEACVVGRDVLMVAPTGSGKSLTFHIAPFLLDFYKHGERNLVDTVCRGIFPLVLVMKEQVSILREKWVKAVVLGLETSERENKEASIRGKIQPRGSGLFISPNDQGAAQAVKYLRHTQFFSRQEYAKLNSIFRSWNKSTRDPGGYSL